MLSTIRLDFMTRKVLLIRRGINRRTFLKYSAGRNGSGAGISVLKPSPGAAVWNAAHFDVGQHRRQATEDEVLQGFTDKFGANVEIEFSPDSYDTKLLAGYGGGNAPDIFLWWNYPQLTVRIWAARHHCLMSMAAARSTSASTSNPF